jgi:hypothetical protein
MVGALQKTVAPRVVAGLDAKMAEEQKEGERRCVGFPSHLLLGAFSRDLSGGTDQFYERMIAARSQR